MSDELAERIAEALIARAFAPSEAYTIGDTAADVAREWMEGQAVVDGEVVDLPGPCVHCSGRHFHYRLIPTED